MEDKKQGNGFWAGFVVGALIASAIAVFINFMLYQPKEEEPKVPQAIMTDER